MAKQRNRRKYVQPTQESCHTPNTQKMNHSHILYTDGACLYNPGGKGGIGCVIVDKHNRKLTSFKKGYKSTTNNRMELIAVIEGILTLDEMNPSAALVCSDSQYVVNGMTKGWVKKWIGNNWMRGEEPVKNPDLWKILHALVTQSPYPIKFQWVKGHSSNVRNNECDALAGDAARRGPYLHDRYNCTLPGF